MKLTLAMGLQYDNGKEVSMVALSLGQNKSSAGMQQHEMAQGGLLQALEMQSSSVQPSVIQAPTPAQNAPIASGHVLPIQAEKMNAAFFLTYNMKGFSDTLIFEHSLLDLFV